MGYDAGFPKAANYGIDLADTDFVFLINPDTFPDNCILKLEDFSNHSIPCNSFSYYLDGK